MSSEAQIVDADNLHMQPCLHHFPYIQLAGVTETGTDEASVSDVSNCIETVREQLIHYIAEVKHSAADNAFAFWVARTSFTVPRNW